jgi:hypothetical protein
LSIKVVNKQSGEFIRQIDFQGFQAMEFSTHGYKGRYVDNAASPLRRAQGPQFLSSQ